MTARLHYAHLGLESPAGSPEAIAAGHAISLHGGDMQSHPDPIEREHISPYRSAHARAEPGPAWWEITGANCEVKPTLPPVPVDPPELGTLLRAAGFFQEILPEATHATITAPGPATPGGDVVITARRPGPLGNLIRYEQTHTVDAPLTVTVTPQAWGGVLITADADDCPLPVSSGAVVAAINDHPTASQWVVASTPADGGAHLFPPTYLEDGDTLCSQTTLAGGDDLDIWARHTGEWADGIEITRDGAALSVIGRVIDIPTGVDGLGVAEMINSHPLLSQLLVAQPGLPGTTHVDGDGTLAGGSNVGDPGTYRYTPTDAPNATGNRESATFSLTEGPDGAQYTAYGCRFGQLTLGQEAPNSKLMLGCSALGGYLPVADAAVPPWTDPPGTPLVRCVEAYIAGHPGCVRSWQLSLPYEVVARPCIGEAGYHWPPNIVLPAGSNSTLTVEVEMAAPTARDFFGQWHSAELQPETFFRYENADSSLLIAIGRVQWGQPRAEWGDITLLTLTGHLSRSATLECEVQLTFEQGGI